MTQTAVLKQSTSHSYIGAELELFAKAFHWKTYLRDRIAPWLAEEVLEVGAGIGGTTRMLCSGNQKRWLCLEPDPLQGLEVELAIKAGTLPSCCEARVGTLADLGDERFDVLLYIDVLEHIEDDRGELNRAALFLRPGGRLIVLAPAHQWLFTAFDRSVGHFRRYNKRMMRELRPDGLELRGLDYIDSAGLLASLANRCFLRQAMPTPWQIQTWDRWLVPASRALDPCLRGSLGKSILGMWTKFGNIEIRI